jgi:hypothetical protein
MRASDSRCAFIESVRLVVRNPSILVPALLAGTLAAVVEAHLEPPQPLNSDIGSRLLQAIVLLVSSILSIAYTTGMADAAWRTGRTVLGDGTLAIRRDAGSFVGAILAFVAVGVVAVALAPFTIWISLLIFMFFGAYTMAAAVVAGRPGFDAIADSIDIAFRRPRSTLLAVAAIVLVAFAMDALAEFVAAGPLVGRLVSAVVVQTAIAYVTVVIVDEYRAVRACDGKGARPAGP